MSNKDIWELFERVYRLERKINEVIDFLNGRFDNPINPRPLIEYLSYTGKITVVTKRREE